MAALCRKLKIRHQRSKKNHKESEVWWDPRPKKRKDRISEAIKESVNNLFLSPDINREVPDKRAAVKIKDGTKKVIVQRHYMTMFDTYSVYGKVYPENHIEFTAFTKLRPKQVKRVSETKRRTCLCHQCCNIALKLDAVKSFCRKECPLMIANVLQSKDLID